VLRKPRPLLTVNSLHDFFSTVFYEKISGIPASGYLWVMDSRRVEEIFFNRQSTNGSRQRSN